MAQPTSEKTEKPTPRKRTKSREEGQVARSTEVNTAFCSAVIFAVFMSALPAYIGQLAEVLRSFFDYGSYIATTDALTPRLINSIFIEIILKFMTIMMPLFIAAVLAGIAVNLLQVRFLFTSKVLRPKISRISILSGFKRMFSGRSIVELLKSLVKVVILGWLVYSDYVDLLEKLPLMMGLNLYDALMETLNIALRIALKCTVGLGALALLDFLYQWRKHEKDLMMTKQEVKDEYIQTEGNPQTKNRIRSKMRQMSAMRMIANVPSADVVITNPTHFAVALRYEEGVDSAPVVVAKGQDFLALKIREVARENYVQIVENKELARSLYAACEPGDEIPEEFYYAVVDVLVYIAQQKNRSSRNSQYRGGTAVR